MKTKQHFLIIFSSKTFTVKSGILTFISIVCFVSRLQLTSVLKKYIKFNVKVYFHVEIILGPPAQCLMIPLQVPIPTLGIPTLFSHISIVFMKSTYQCHFTKNRHKFYLCSYSILHVHSSSKSFNTGNTQECDIVQFST